MTTGRSTVAVVVPTRDRAGLLRRCLGSLAEQRCMPTEVVVVDDASTDQDATRRVLDDFQDRLPLRVLHHGLSTGPAVARNHGWQATSADLVAFTDDDCRADPWWLAALLDAAAPQRVLVGRTSPDPLDGEPRSVLDRTMRVDAQDGRFSTCNVVYPRQLLVELQGFDPRFRHAYCEDTDLGQRALDAGADAVYVLDALVHHAVHRMSLLGMVRDRRRVRYVPLLVRRHPRVRQQVCDGLFLRHDHRSALGAIGGLALFSLTPAGIPAVERWLDEILVHGIGPGPRAWRAREVVLTALTELVEIAVCGWGSLRYRSLLL